MKTIEFVTGAGDGPPGVAASISFTVIGEEGVISDIDFTEVTGEAGTSVAHHAGTPEALRLGANFPNPFTETTTIPFELTEGGDVNLQIFDLLGRRVAVVVNETLPAGRHEARDRKSTRLNSSHVAISYAVFCLKKKIDIYK